MIAIRGADPGDPRIGALLAHHFAEMRGSSPRDACHVMAADALAAPDIALYAAWDGDTLAGVGALRALGPDQGEIKSMRVADGYRGRGIGRAILDAIEAEARARGYARLSLETGNSALFDPALGLYRRRGYVDGPPFAGYPPTDFTIFLHKEF